MSASKLTYQWLHNGTIMEHESGTVLTITNVSIADSGAYQCKVIANVEASATSDSVQLYIMYTYKPGARSKLATL